MSSIIEADLKQILALTAPLWEEMRGGRLFITGGTGFFGKWLLESFIHANLSLNLQAEAVVLTRKPEAFNVSNPNLVKDSCIRLHEGSLDTFSFPEGPFTHLIHAASEISSSNQADPVGLISTTVAGAKRVCHLAAASGVRKFLYTSSGAVYGPASAAQVATTEEAPASRCELSPKGAYGQSKQIAELIICLLAQENGFEAKIARGFAFLGPFADLTIPLAAPSFLRKALLDETIEISGHGQNFISRQGESPV
jgi:nucleoside-diphosphate-sugar epimerase